MTDTTPPPLATTAAEEEEAAEGKVEKGIGIHRSSHEVNSSCGSSSTLTVEGQPGGNRS